ncbi:GNAT family N-acetyltransferase [Lunatibacter salilacus]|uniref:GNAT family N-acetyltransferase n=1 Tax=Lunatibacter salilacus TaxID=2483804 RepID=UPI00131D525D|nr:GNAT family N-acetyltransferase [Lunatibacter salilacus]
MELITLNTQSKIELLIGEEVTAFIEDPVFLRKWKELYDTCTWATVFQSSEFVKNWYSIFTHKYLPILVKFEKEDELAGLLTMSIKRNGQGKLFIVFAGHGESDCQTWLSTLENSDFFIVNALRMIKEKFPKNDILLRNLPPSVPLGWVKTQHEKGFQCILHAFKRPIINLENFSISKRNRKRVNRLMQIGQHEYVTDLNTFKSYVDQLVELYDFRQGAMFNRSPYSKNPEYKAFLISLFENGLIKVSIFQVQTSIIAALIVTSSGDMVHLGAINVHSPQYSAYSPGYIQFLLMSTKVASEGVKYFDLTPGDDPYKDRLATEFDVVNTMVVTSRLTFKIKREIRKYFHYSLLKLGIRPLSFQLKLEKMLHKVKDKGVLTVGMKSIRNAIVKRNKSFHSLPENGIIGSNGFILQRNNIGDLLKFESKNFTQTKWEFLESAMQNFENGKELITYTSNGELKIAAWFQHASKIEISRNKEPVPENSVILDDLVFHKDAKDGLKPFIFQAQQLIQKEFGTKEILLLSEIDFYH